MCITRSLRNRPHAVRVVGVWPGVDQWIWRGYVDGDGCFYMGTGGCYFTLVGTVQQDWSAVETLLQRLDIPYRIYATHLDTGNSSTIRVTSRYAIDRLGKWLYEGFPEDGIGLNRKYLRWIMIRDHCSRHCGSNSPTAPAPDHTGMPQPAVYSQRSLSRWPTRPVGPRN